MIRHNHRVALLLAIGFIIVTSTIPGRGASRDRGTGGAVCIDPGHPSEVNSGRTVQNGLTEVGVNWRVAGELARILRAKGIRVVLTKHSRDEFVRNRTRAGIANGCSASLMIRLHCDTGRGSGFAVYYPNREGKSDGRTGPSTEVMKESARAAGFIRGGLSSTLKNLLNDGGVKGESATAVGRRQGALTGSIFSKGPVVTVEMVFLSNKKDAVFIGSSRGRKKVANGLATGILEWLAHGGYVNR